MKKYSEKIRELKNVMLNDFVCVNKYSNPISKDIENLSKKQKEYIIGQYTIFPKHIVSFLEKVRDNCEDMKFFEVSEELTRNMGEELGTRSGGKTHYDILINGINDELDLDVFEVDSSESTFEFVNNMRKVFSSNDIYYNIGGILATEMSANPELMIVLDLVNSHTKIKDSMLKKFFDMHIQEWEPGHEEGLNRTCDKYIRNQRDIEKFEKGFKEVLSIMDNWWNGMYREAMLY